MKLRFYHIYTLLPRKIEVEINKIPPRRGIDTCREVRRQVTYRLLLLTPFPVLIHHHLLKRFTLDPLAKILSIFNSDGIHFL